MSLAQRVVDLAEIVRQHAYRKPITNRVVRGTEQDVHVLFEAQQSEPHKRRRREHERGLRLANCDLFRSGLPLSRGHQREVRERQPANEFRTDLLINLIPIGIDSGSQNFVPRDEQITCAFHLLSFDVSFKPPTHGNVEGRHARI